MSALKNTFLSVPPVASDQWSSVKWARVLPWWLAAATFMVFLPALNCGFINLDDPEYFSANPQVLAGLNWGGIKWAFSAGNFRMWHPVTWLSLMLDAQLFGAGARGPHLVNVLLHALNTGLLFVLLRKLTGSIWRSALVAALFAWHPLRVESVAWVCERKDVLSGCFGLLTLLAYARYVEEGKRQKAKGKKFYALALVFFALGLMSKPMLVTLPFVLLLLDFWPLRRFELSTINHQLSTLLREKLPFFALSLALSAGTFLMHRDLGSLMGLPLAARVANAFVAVVLYLGKIIWPVKLAIFYPHVGHWPVLVVLAAGLLIIGVSVLVVVRRRRFPVALFGWCWFVGVLIPVSGLIQAGEQGLADRFTYLPSIGLFVAVVWLAGEVCVRKQIRRRWLVVMTAGLLAGCVLQTGRQLTFWRDSETLFRHALAVTENNHVAYNGLGYELYRQPGGTDQAMTNYLKSLAISPHYTEALNNLGIALADQGKFAEAVESFEAALQISPNSVRFRNNLGVALLRAGRFAEATEQFRAVLAREPGNLMALENFAQVYLAEKNPAGAIHCYNEILRHRPDELAALNALAWLLATSAEASCRDGGRAVALAERAAQLTQNRNAGVLDTLSAAYAEVGRFNEAVKTAAAALALATGNQVLTRQIGDHLKNFRERRPCRE